MDYRLVEVEPGHAVFEATPGEQHYNPIGVVHGGLAMTLLDSAMGCAVQTQMPAGGGYTTLEAKTNLVRAVTSDTGKLRAIGKVLHLGKRIATAEARLEDAAGKLYAHATTTCMVPLSRSVPRASSAWRCDACALPPGGHRQTVVRRGVAARLSRCPIETNVVCGSRSLSETVEPVLVLLG